MGCVRSFCQVQRTIIIIHAGPEVIGGVRLMGVPGGVFIYLRALFALLNAISWSWSAWFHFILEGFRETIAAVVACWFSLLGTDKGPAPNPSDFQIAIERHDLTRSRSIHGNVDDPVRRDPDGRLTLSGWAVDLELGQPLSVFAFVGGNFEPIAITKGRRDEVTRDLRLSAEQAKDVVFAGRIERPVNCGPDSIFRVVAINQRKQLGIIYRVRNPGCGEP